METEDDDYGGITTSALNGGTEEEISYRQRILEEIALRLLEDGSVEDETESQKDEAAASVSEQVAGSKSPPATSVSGEDDIEKCIVEGLPKAAEVVTESEETKDHPKPHPEEEGPTSQQSLMLNADDTFGIHSQFSKVSTGDAKGLSLRQVSDSPADRDQVRLTFGSSLTREAACERIYTYTPHFLSKWLVTYRCELQTGLDEFISIWAVLKSSVVSVLVIAPRW
ncbi:hypothetical protein Bbelb_010150 [Branchiostoma belcheri]|nr:hypothetical protein Bbelb_010150 [Branchiostoma belcheri]